MGHYERPPDLAQALARLSDGSFTPLAGGTDFYPARVGKPLDDNVLDLSRIGALRGISEEGEHWRLGALTTWTDLIETPLPPVFDGYKAAAREVGGVQIQNTGTLAGNLCNASPAADGTPNLLALDAVVELQSATRLKRVPVSRFVLGNRRTGRESDEIVTALIVPKPKGKSRSVFLKLGARKYLVISIVMVAAVIEEAPDGRVAAARIAVGSCSAVAQRLPGLESALHGLPTQKMANAVTFEHLAVLSPISDVRGTAAYRNDAALELVRRALVAAIQC
jgi:CO/xanthine dehydrogenase FAD-binding subunit